MRWLAAVMAIALGAPQSAAQDMRVVIASAPSDRSVTIYRAPGRNGGALALGALRGFAMITETREVDLPPGEARLAFEGVADGIVAQSALISGLPGGVIEKNRDDALLSPSTLMHAVVGRTVQLQRVDRKTGKVTRTPARVLSASDQGVVFATAQGNEALRCSGLPETFHYSDGGEGLYAQPTLSVLTRSPVAVHARVTLTYLAENFDWNASYVARIGAGGATLDLTGWITLANGNGVSFPAAQTQIVAGGLNRAYVQSFINDQPEVVARCWPLQTTSDIPERTGQPYQLVQPWMGEPARMKAQDIIVTAQRAYPAAMAAAPAPPPPPEQLGDLKLYRVPERTTIAARQMKQTRLIDQRAVPFETYYRADVDFTPWRAAQEPLAATTMLRTVNDKAHQLGLALPAGAMLVEQDQAGQVAVLGEPVLRDTAEAEKLDLALGAASDVTCAWQRRGFEEGARTGQIVVTLTNAMAHAAPVELRLRASGGWSIDGTSDEAPKIDGVPTVKLSLASGEARQLTIGLTRDR